MKVPLVDVCDFQGGSQPPKDEWTYHATPGYVRMLQIRDFTQAERVNAEYVKETKNLKRCETDDILVGRYGASVGKILTGLSGAYNVAIVKVIPDESKIQKRYLFHYLNSPYFQNFILSVGSRAAQAGFNRDDLKNVMIPLLNLDIQHQVIRTLDKIDNMLALRKQQLDKLDELVKARFVEMFGDPAVNPMRWSLVPLLEMGKCKNGMNFHDGDSGIEMHCLGVGDFKDLSAIHDTSKLSKVSLNEMPNNDYLLKDEDIVFVRSNGNKALVGRCLAVYPGNVLTTFSGFCIRYRRHSEKTNTEYLLQVLKSDSMRKKMVGRGANIQNLNQQILASLDIPVPPRELQHQFTLFANQIEKCKLTIQQGLDKLKMLKKALMQEYFG